MKRFWRSLAGKVILYISVILTFVIGLAACCGIALAGEYGYYSNSWNTVKEETIRNKALLESYDLVERYNSGVLSGSDEYVTNYRYQLFDTNGNLVAWSHDINPETGDNQSFAYSFTHIIGDSNDAYIENSSVSKYVVNISCVSDQGNSDLNTELNFYHVIYKLKYALLGIVIVSFVLFVISIIGLTVVSARRKEDNELHPGALNKVPFDLLFGGTIVGVATIGAILYEISGDNDIFEIVMCIASVLLIPGFIMSIAARIKQKTLLKNTVIYMCCSWLKKLFVSIPLVWRTALVLFVIHIIELFCVCADTGVGLLVIAIEKLISIPLILYVALMLRKLQAQGKRLADGDLNTKEDTKGLILEFKKHAENLNSIADGMNIAVEQKMKSERMKTELITNVSHDIKTPLTSIINYCTLIEGEKTDNEKISEYTEVVVRQSNKLKILIENLVEASKASTGNLESNPVPCGASMFVTQVDGEYEEKIKAADLTLVTKVINDDLTIMADGRHMWRVFDNLMNNICKYSKEGTRVFLTLEEQDGNAVFTFKNTSREPLDISEEELMERFVRGDSSRNTEGNGLGLSIARSLTELQNGTLNIDIDGDYFKAILKFPIVKQ